ALHWHPFTGDMNAVYDQTDILVSCGLVDSLGRTVPEAMRRGIPVVVNAVGAAKEVIEDGVNGLLYDGTPAGLAGAVRRLLDEPGLAQSVARQAALDTAQFDPTHYAMEIERILRSVVRLGSGGPSAA
ncbi:MAG: glycosyltransferase family 4 protein, partial [Vicinamibacterales bacterium]